MKRDHVLTIFVAALLALAPVAARAGNEGRIAGEVVNPEGEPVADVKVTVIGTEVETSKEATTNRKGRFSMLILDATRSYKIRFEAEGYDVREEPIRLNVGGVLRGTWTLYPEGSRGASAEELARIEAHNKMARAYNEGAELFEAGDMMGAKAKMSEALAEDPDLPQALDALARINLELAARAEEGEKAPYYEETLEATGRLRELLPAERAPVVLSFEALAGLGRWDEAEALLPTLVEMESIREAAVGYFKIGVATIRAGDLARAKASFTRSVELRPDLKEAYLNLALIAQAEGDAETVVRHADAYLERDPGNGRALTMKYEALQALGRKEEADAAFAELASADPTVVADNFFREGTELWNDGRAQEAQAKFERVLQIVPDHPRAHYQLGLCYASAGDSAKAKQYLARFLELAPEDPEAELARQMLGSL
ncbi:MAG: tetratricopeptide repeat protein [Thermoanaerobaculia bacterium]|nr:tetratricopeptide repeat protein [Thermoanaerobaculia bacterium]